MPTVHINHTAVEIGPAERLNCIQAAAKIGVEIPAYCWHPDLSVVASCRMCLVEVGDLKPDGTVQMQPKLVPGCQTPVKDGTVIISDSPKVKEARKATLEYLLLNHPLDCPTCDQAGECFLQDYSYRHGRSYSRLQEPKNIKPDKPEIGEQITLFTDRCIMCTRCVRFTREISGSAELQVVSRGTHEEIDIFPGYPCNNKLAGNVVDLCPVGALCSKDFLYEQRVWWLKEANSVCPGCSTGCSIEVHQNEEQVYRLKPRPNPQAQGSFMCDEGRFGWKYIHADQRLTHPIQRQRSGQVVSRRWDQVLQATDTALRAAAKAGALAGVFSPWMTVEEAYLLATYLRSLDAKATLALGPVWTAEADDCYPKDIRGQVVEPVKFTIRAEKCPNRRGVELVLQHFNGPQHSSGPPDFNVSSGQLPKTLDDVLRLVREHKLAGVYLVGGDPAGWISAEAASTLQQVGTVVVQDLLSSPASDVADFVLAGGSFAEREGTFLNHAGLAQEIRRSIRGPEESRPDGRILWDLSGRIGLFHAANLRKEIAAAIPALAVLAVGRLPDDGLFLAAN